MLWFDIDRRNVGALLLALAVGLALLALPVPRAQAQEVAPCPGFCPLATFDDYANGSLRSQGPWQVNTPGATDGALAGDDVPVVFSGKTMLNELDTAEPVQYRGNAYAELGDLAVQDGVTGTLFLEVLTTDTSATALNLGLSDDESPGLGFDTTGDELDLNDYEVQLTLDDRGFVVRDGAEDRVVDNVAFEAGQRYAIWMVVDNGGDTYQVRIAAGDGAPVVASSGGDDRFAFRNGTGAPLLTYLHLNDPDDPPTAVSYIDNIYVDPDAASLDDPSPVFEEVTRFDDYADGSLAGVDGWQTSSASVVVTGDPQAEGNEGNKVVGMTGPRLWARRAVPALAPGSEGTVFFRLYRGGPVDTSAGLSDVDAPAAFGDFEVQANVQSSSTLNARDGGAFAAAGTLAEDAWQCVWMVADNETDTYEMYSRGGPYAVTTRLPVDEETQFAFRNGTAEALDRFLLVNGASSPGELYLDDVAVDADGRNLRVPGGDAASCAPTDPSDVPVEDPIPSEPVASGLGLTLEEYVTIPPSSGGTPAARINYLGQIPDGSGRRYVPDLNGSMYLVVDGEPVEYLDVAAQFGDFSSSPNLGTGFGFVAFHPEFATNGRLYTVHTEAGDALTSQQPDLPAPATTSVHGVVTEWTADDPAAGTFSGTRREVLRLGFDTFLHGIQEVNFNPTARPGDEDYGLLYLGVGDGEEVPNFTDGPQNLGVPQGKILRIDPLGSDGAGGGYGVPASNPFVGQAGVLGEIYAYGLRNPHRFSWDPAGDNRMFLGMIGESNVDSIYEVLPGDNFGWNEREGAFLFKKSDPTNVYPLPPDDEQYGYTYPVAGYDHDTGRALVGGFVYRGSDVPELQGKYVFGDIVSGRVFYTEVEQMRRGGPLATIYELALFTPSGTPTTMQQLAGRSRVDFRLGVDAAGELYILSKANGGIWRVGSGPGSASCAFGDTVVTDVLDAEDWAPVTPDKWEFPGDEVILAEAGEARPGARRPFEYAVLTAGPEFGSVQIDAEVRLDTPVTVSNRDVIIVFGYRSDTELYYAHLSQDNTIYPHNGIFVVNNADRLRIDDQWDGTVGAPPAVTDEEFHAVRVTHCAETGEIAVYVDGAETPLMTATDSTFDSGRIGFGSFDNVGRLRALTATGTAVEPANQSPVVQPVGDQAVDEGTPLTVQVEASDPDADAVTLSLAEAPEGAMIDPATGVVTWTPSEADGPGQFPFTVVATDDGGLTGTTRFTVAVAEVNAPPALEPIGDLTVVVGQRVEVAAVADDPDLPENTLTYSLAGPPGATIDPGTGVITWTPGSVPDGPAPFAVSVSDGSAETTVVFSVTVVDPRLVCGGGQATIVGTGRSDTIVGTAGNDVIVGLGGGDRIVGRGGDDVICGGAGDDVIVGDAGDDTLYGGRGDDVLAGSAGGDTLYGGAGSDVLAGGAGDRVEQGGPDS